MIQPLYTSGWYHHHRMIYGTDLWRRQLEYRLYEFLYSQAVFDSEGRMAGKVHVKRGQYLRSYSKLSEDLAYIENNATKMYTPTQIQRAVKYLERNNWIKTKLTEHGTLFTIIGYDELESYPEADTGKDQYSQGLCEACAEPATGLDTPHTSILANNDGLKKESDNQLDTGHDTSLIQACDKTKKEKKLKKDKYNPESIEFQLASLLYSLIKARDENYPQPKFQKWADEVRKLIEIDKRSPIEIEEVIKYCQDNEFWQDKILSTENLRKNFGMLYLQYKKQKEKSAMMNQNLIKRPLSYVQDSIFRSQAYEEFI